MDDNKQENSPTSSGSSAVTGRMPVLRFRINFDLDLNAILGMFAKNSTQTIPLALKCGVEKLSERR